MRLFAEMLTPDQERVKMLLCETITMLCKNGLRFESELQIDGLIGITLDRRDVFLVTMKELIGLQDDMPYIRQYQQNCSTSDRDVLPEIAAQHSEQNVLSLRQPVVITPLLSPKSVRRSTLETRTSEPNRAQVPDRFHHTPHVPAAAQNLVSNSICGMAKHRDSVSETEIPSTITALKAGTVEKCGPEMTLEMAMSGDNEMATLSERHVVRVENRLGDAMSCNDGAYTDNSDSAETTRTATVEENNSSSSTRCRLPRYSVEDRSSVSQSSVVDSKDEPEDFDSDDQVVIIKEEPGTSQVHRGDWKYQSSDLEPWKKTNPHFSGFSSSPHPAGMFPSSANMQHHSSESRQRSHSAQSSAAEWDARDPSTYTTSNPSSTTSLTKDHTSAGSSYASRNFVDGTSSDVSSYQDDSGQMEMAARGGGGRLDTSSVGYPPAKPRSMRSTFTRFQTSRLELEFEHSHYVSKELRLQLMRELNLTENIITVWFQNRRQKLKQKLKAHAAYLSSHEDNNGSG